MCATLHSIGTPFQGKEFMTEEEKAAAEAAAKQAAEAEAALKAKLEQETADKKVADDEAARKSVDTSAAEQVRAAELEALRKQLEELQAQTARFQGLDPDKAREAIKVAEEADKARVAAEKEKAKAEGNFEKLRELQQAEAEALVNSAKEEAERAKAEAEAARQELARAKVETAFANSKFLQEETILSGPKAQRLFADHVEIEDGKVVVYDAPAGSNRRAQIMDAKGNPLSFNDAIKKVIENDPDKDTLLRTKTKPGAGSSTTDGKSPDKSVSRHDRLKQGIAKLRGI
jgi:hypothetical protein